LKVKSIDNRKAPSYNPTNEGYTLRLLKDAWITK